MIWLVLLVVYLVGWYRTSLMLAKRANEREERIKLTKVDEDDRRFNLGMAMFAALAWPVVLPVLLIHSRMMPHVGPTNAELKRENERMSREIEKLEREAGI